MRGPTQVIGRDILRCPKMSLIAGHYYADGSCRCSERPAAVEEVKRCRRNLEAARQSLRRAEETLRIS